MLNKNHSRWRRMIVCLALAGVLGPLLSSHAWAESQARAVARQLVERAGTQRGICAVLGGDPAVALEMARLSELLVNARQPNRKEARELMKRSDAAGYGIRRLAVESGPLDKLPYADRLIDIVVVPPRTSEPRAQMSMQEIVRVLRPAGTAILAAGDHD